MAACAPKNLDCGRIKPMHLPMVSCTGISEGMADAELSAECNCASRSSCVLTNCGGETMHDGGGGCSVTGDDGATGEVRRREAGWGKIVCQACKRRTGTHPTIPIQQLTRNIASRTRKKWCE